MKKLLLTVLLINFGIVAFAQEPKQDSKYTTKHNVHYYDDAVNQADEYISERCVLDIYYPENAYMMRMMKVVGHKETKIHEIKGIGHGMVRPACPLLLDEVARIIEKKKSARK